MRISLPGISNKQPCKSDSPLGHEASPTTSQPCTKKRPPKTQHRFGQLTCSRRQMGERASTQATQSLSFRSGGLRAHNAATRDRSFLYRPHTASTVRVSAFPHLCRRMSAGALSPKHAPVLGWRPSQQAAAKPRASVTSRTAFTFLSQSAHAPSCMCSAAHTMEERRGPMERSPDDVPMPLRFEPKAVMVFNVLHVWALPWGWLVALAPSLRKPPMPEQASWPMTLVHS